MENQAMNQNSVGLRGGIEGGLRARLVAALEARLADEAPVLRTQRLVAAGPGIGARRQPLGLLILPLPPAMSLRALSISAITALLSDTGRASGAEGGRTAQPASSAAGMMNKTKRRSDFIQIIS